MPSQLHILGKQVDSIRHEMQHFQRHWSCSPWLLAEAMAPQKVAETFRLLVQKMLKQMSYMWLSGATGAAAATVDHHYH